MDGKTIQKFFENEVQSMIDVYTNFETLIPASNGEGASHRGEDGRFVETLIRSYLSKYLPKDLDVLTGFIVRPAVKRDEDRSRKTDDDSHSKQLDIVVYNSSQYPVYMRYGDTAVVPPEGVIGIISVKKTLRDQDIENELNALKEASKLCRDKKLRGPFLALVSMDSGIEKKRSITSDNEQTENSPTFEWMFRKIEKTYKEDDNLAFDDTVGYIGVIKKWSIFKRNPKENPNEAQYVALNYKDGEQHLSLQFLLTGLLSVYYDTSRNPVERPGFTGFPSGRDHDKYLGSIPVKIPAKITPHQFCKHPQKSCPTEKIF